MIKHIFLIALSFTVVSCSANKKELNEEGYKLKSKIAMQRVKDTSPLAKQDLVSREAMQYAMLDKMNVREERQRREFNRIQEDQREQFLKAHQENVKQLEEIETKISDSTNKYIEIADKTNKELIDALNNFNDGYNSFQLIATDLRKSVDDQSVVFKELKDSYDTKVALDQAKIEREKERENSIRGVVENMYEDHGVALQKFYQSTKSGMLPPSEWVDLEDARISLHVDGESLKDLMLRAINHAAINAGPWNLKWKLDKENEDLLLTEFNLDTESSFGDFITNVKAYIINYNGVRLYFRVFKEKRLLVVSDS